MLQNSDAKNDSKRKKSREKNPFEMVKLPNGDDVNETEEVIIHVDFRLRQMHILTSFFIIIAHNTQQPDLNSHFHLA